MHLSRLITALLMLLTAVPAGADEWVSLGDEFQVNTFTTGNQGFADVARAPDGSFLLAWESGDDHDGDDFGIFAQRMSAAGAPLGAEFQVNTFFTGPQYEPAIAAGPDGEYVVVWQSYGQDGSGFGIFGQRYDAGGMALGGEFPVNSFTVADQGYPAVAIDATGQFLVVWESYGQDQSFGGIYAQHYDSDGMPIGGEFRVHTTTLDNQNDPDIVATADGFIVTWESDQVDMEGEAVVLQFFDQNADPVGGEIQVNASEADDQENPSIAALPDGTFAVVWESDGQDGIGESVVARVFDADGVPVSGEILLNSTVTGDQEDPRLAANGTDGFLAVWEGPSPMGDDEVWGRHFDAMGQVVGDEFRINTETADDQDTVAVAGGAPGRFLVAWRSFGAQDGEAAGVFAQGYERALFVDGFESGDTMAWSITVP